MEQEATPRLEQVAHGVRRVLAPNPGPFTYSGTQTYIVGERQLAVIDPGPDDPAHLELLLRAIGAARVEAILITHNHLDHSPAAPALRAETRAPVIGCAPLALDDRGPRSDAGFDRNYAPDAVLGDGESVSGEGWTLSAVATPGHTSNHLCFALPEGDALFTGDHVMGWSTTVISPPDGDMIAYMDSLQKLRVRRDRVYFPTHGPPVTRPAQLVRGLVAHRRQRERQILDLMGEGLVDIPAMVGRMYASIDPQLHPAAGRSVLAHLIALEREGRVRQEADRWIRLDR